MKPKMLDSWTIKIGGRQVEANWFYAADTLIEKKESVRMNAVHSQNTARLHKSNLFSAENRGKHT